MKFIAYYLPQFHEIPENNKWWGEGFTEWVNVKKAKPLFKGHNQPRIPLDNNYYDLSDTHVMEKQAKTAKAFGIDGFCFYHYWFDGKLLLEKPLLNLLDNKQIDISFCLCWANEPWARTWDGKDKNVLMEQKYGDKSDWEKHFNYLLKFFRDERYIQVNGSPMLVLYKTKDIENLEEMLTYWDELAVKYGLNNGLHIVETMGGKQSQPTSKQSQAVVEFEPSLSLGKDSSLSFWIKNKLKMLMNKGLYTINYNDVARTSVNRNEVYGKPCYLGCFPGWDNTPRKGNRGVTFNYATPENFYNYLYKQALKMEKNSFLFINAWNEWAEGAYLEPDTYNGYQFLDAVKKVKNKFPREN